MADTDLEGASGGAEPLQRSNDDQNVQSTNDDHGNIDFFYFFYLFFFF